MNTRFVYEWVYVHVCVHIYQCIRLYMCMRVYMDSLWVYCGLRDFCENKLFEKKSKLVSVHAAVHSPKLFFFCICDCMGAWGRSPCRYSPFDDERCWSNGGKPATNSHVSNMFGLKGAMKRPETYCIGSEELVSSMYALQKDQAVRTWALAYGDQNTLT